MIKNNNNTAFTQKLSFKKAQVNILAMSDNHGKIQKMPDLYNNISNNWNDIFPNANKESNPKSMLNLTLVNGDWFFNPSKKGFITDAQNVMDPKENRNSFGELQFKFLDVLDRLIKGKPVEEISVNARPDSVKSSQGNFYSFFNLGNHEFDGGDIDLFNFLKKLDFITLLTNTNIKDSKVLKNLTNDEKFTESQDKRFVKSKVLDIVDDKNPDITNKVLMLGVVTPGLDFYSPGHLYNTNVFDKKGDSTKKFENNVAKTATALNNEIQNFKSKHPNGAIVLMAHTGLPVLKNILNDPRLTTPPDIVFNGHDHKDQIDTMDLKGKQIKIASLDMNNNKFVSSKVFFDDNGIFQPDKTLFKDYLTPKVSSAQGDNPFVKLIDHYLSKDLQSLVEIKSDKYSDSLNANEARTSNSILANIISDAVLQSLNENNFKVDAFGFMSTALRQDLPLNKKISNMEFSQLLSGCTEDLGEVFVGKVSGENLIKIVMENVYLHQQDRSKMDRNTLMQWAGISFNKAKMMNIMERYHFDLNKEPNGSYSRMLKEIQKSNSVKILLNGQYSDIIPDKDYNVALTSYFTSKKDRIPTATKLLANEENFVNINKTFNTLLYEYMEKHNYTFNADEHDDIRIIS